jgi:membrane fusion protein (multidrug efflux system)
MRELNQVSEILGPGDQSAPVLGARPEAARFPLARLGWIAAAVIVAALILGLLPKWRARTALVSETKAALVPTVSIALPAGSKAAAGVALPAEVRPYVEAPIYARANGYLKKWLVDIGDHVKEGQVLAEIDTPELDQELVRSQAELGQAQAALDLAKTTAARWADLLKTSSVSEQEAAEKQADLALKTATVEAARANVQRLEQLKSFSHLTAPFAGTITARRTDVGQLITAAAGRDLFRLAQTATLRVFVRVPQTMARGIEPGQKAEVIFAELPGRHFEAKVIRTAGAMEPESRTLLTELELENSKGEVLAGSYAQVRFAETKGDATLTIPSSSLLFRSEGTQVAIVDQNSKVQLVRVTSGRDFGQRVEILEGVSASDRVVVNPPDSIIDGMEVKVMESSPLATHR